MMANWTVIRREGSGKSQGAGFVAHFFGIVFLACMLANLGMFGWNTTAELFFPYDLNYGEGLLIDIAQRMGAGKTVYRPILNQPPYVVDNYPPLYPLAVAVVRRITHLPALPVARAISLASAWLGGLIVGMLAYRLTQSRLSGLVAGTLFLGNLFVMGWSSLARVDLMALTLSLAALWLLFTVWHSWAGLSASIVCLLAAIYTRQTYIVAVPLAGAIWLWHNDRRRALAFVTALAVGSLALFLVLNSISQGGFYLGTVVANIGSYRVSRAVAISAMLMLVWPVVLVTAGIEVAHTLKTRHRRIDRTDLGSGVQSLLFYGLLPYTVGACVAALTAGKIGSDVNYFLEVVAALAIWVAVALARQGRRGTVHLQPVPVLMVFQIVWMLVIGVWLGSQTAARWRDLPRYNELMQEVREAAAQGPVLADDYSSMVVLAGQQLYIEPFMYHQLNSAGLVDTSGLANSIKAQEFPLILLNRPGSAVFLERWPIPIIEAIEENYEGTEHLPGLVVYRPRVRHE